VPGSSLVTRTGVRLVYDDLGPRDATPVVLLHALGATRKDWATVVPKLTESFRVISFDLRGHGESDWPGTYSFALMCDDVSDAISQLGLHDVTLIGHSMGAVVCYLLAISEPGRVGRLVIEDAPPPYKRDHPVPSQAEKPEDFDWDVVPAIVNEINRGSPETWTALSEIQAPTLVIAGGESSHIPQELLADVAARIPAYNLVTIDVGHHIHEDAPDRFLDAFRSWHGSINRPR